MIILGIDPGSVSVGWAVLRDSAPIAGGTVRNRRGRRAVSAVIDSLELACGVRNIGIISIEVASRDSISMQVVYAFREYSQQNRIELQEHVPSRVPNGLRWRWRSNHERDAIAVAYQAARGVTPLRAQTYQ